MPAPSDGLTNSQGRQTMNWDQVAPAALKTTFMYDNRALNPETMLPFSRRYYPDKKFTFVAEQFQE